MLKQLMRCIRGLRRYIDQITSYFVFLNLNRSFRTRKSTRKRGNRGTQTYTLASHKRDPVNGYKIR